MAMQAVMARPDMDLVGLVVKNPDKVGRDIGELAGADPVGIAATNDIHEVAASDVDVVLHMPLPSLVYGDNPTADIDNFVTSLSAGKHVVTTAGYMYPQVYGDSGLGKLCQLT